MGMKLLRDPVFTDPCVLVLGMFDGVHRGHQELLMTGRELADELRLPLRVCTFEPHPLQTIRPELAPPLLTTLPERAALMAENGVDEFCVVTFTRQKSTQQPEDFLAQIAASYQPKAIVCGFNFTFGAGGRGNGAMIEAWGKEHDCRTAIIPAFCLGGQTVSSTRIRGLLKQGEVREAARLMGHAYMLGGIVTHGRRIGRKLGFATANVRVSPHKELPRYGVYVCCLITKRGTWACVVNVGEHPTLPGGGITVEAHIPGKRIDLYGENVRVMFLNFIREEHRFADPQELSRQIRQDVRTMQDYFGNE